MKTEFIIGLFVLLAFVAGYYVNGITGNTILQDEDKSQNYSYTKAICNDGHCLDVYVECSNGKATVTPWTQAIAVNISNFNITNEIIC